MLSTEQVAAQLVPPPQVKTPHSASGSVFTGMLVQVPVVPPVFAFVHAWHLLPHAVLQQTPSMQLPLVHSLAPAQSWPLPFLSAQLANTQ